ncbi:MAG: glycosyltransferase [Microbacteriaceae bacterium]
MVAVVGVMSTFRPDSSVAKRALRHVGHLDKLIVVDDGSPDSSALDALTDAAIELIRLPQNAGIAAALNIGIERALAEGAEHIVTLDQDSELNPDYVLRCLATFHGASKRTRLGIVFTECVNRVPAIPHRYSPEGYGLVDEGIQSGMVVSTECLADIGLLDERLFIDCVDIEFALRAIDHGWNAGIAPQTNITHSLGRMEPFRPLGVQRYHNGAPALYQYHPPFRRYYIVRNNIDLCLRNLRRRPRWVISVLRRETGPQINTLLSGPHRAKQHLALAVGIAHGLTRRRGKIPNWLARLIQEHQPG